MQMPLFEKKKINLNPAPWTMHEFFAGSGLVAYGLRGMFSPVWSNDISEKKAAVYRENFDGNHFVLADIKKIKGRDLPFAHLSWASFPCQDLSLAGAMGGIDASRSGLVWEWLRVLDEMSVKPSLLLVENVVGLISSRNGENYKKLHAALLERGYHSGAIILDAALFVPQSRPRVFVISVHHSISVPHHIVGNGSCWLHNKLTTALGEELSGWIWWRAEKPQKRKSKLEEILDFDLPYDKDHILQLIPANHKEKLEKYEQIAVTAYRRTRQGKQCLELRFDEMAGCLRTPEGGSSKQFLVVKRGNSIHARILSPRETARLMGAPDTFSLPGAANDGYKAMGDAVVLPVATFLGEKFLLPLAEAVYAKNYHEKPAAIVSAGT